MDMQFSTEDVKSIIGSLTLENHVLRSRIAALQKELEQERLNFATPNTNNKNQGDKENEF